MEMTSTAIKAAALAYNADYPEAAAEIEAGEATIRVFASSDDGLGRSVKVLAVFGVVGSGGWIEAGAPNVLAAGMRRQDGRLSAVECARRAFGRGFAGSAVPVEWAGR